MNASRPNCVPRCILRSAILVLVAVTAGPVFAQAVAPQGRWDTMTWDSTEVWAFDPNTDTDNDGLLDEDEYELFRTDPFVADTDGDGIADGAEINFFGTNPLNVDTDADTLEDRDEVVLGADPKRADTDGDGLDDGAEVYVYKTDPLLADRGVDTDGDGISNEAEVALYFTDPGVADLTADTDGDGVSNVVEVDLLGTAPDAVTDFRAVSIPQDTDGDGITDTKESELRTSPTEPTSNTQMMAALSALGEAVFKQVAVMPLPLLAGLGGLMGWLALRRRGRKKGQPRCESLS